MDRSRRKSPYEGWALVGWGAVLASVVLAGVVAVHGGGEAGLRVGIRATARLSVTLFTWAFVASSLHRLRPGNGSRWLLRNRRYVGVAFAVCHLAHATLFITLAFRYPASFWGRVSTSTLAGGSVGYVFVLLMTLTSFDRPAAWLGARRWRLLHKTGMYVIWAIFLFSYVSLATRAIWHLVLVAMLLAGAGLRFLAERARARPVTRLEPVAEADRQPSA